MQTVSYGKKYVCYWVKDGKPNWIITDEFQICPVTFNNSDSDKDPLYAHDRVSLVYSEGLESLYVGLVCKLSRPFLAW